MTVSHSLIPRRLKGLFFLSLGVWLLSMGFWLYVSYQPSGSPTASSPAHSPILLQDSEDWMSIYFNKQKIGYSHTVKQRSPGGYQINQDLFLRLMVLGVPRQMQMSSTSRLSSDFLLKEFNFKMVSGYLIFSLQGKVEGTTLTLNTDLAGRPNTVRHII